MPCSKVGTSTATPAASTHAIPSRSRRRDRFAGGTSTETSCGCTDSGNSSLRPSSSAVLTAETYRNFISLYRPGLILFRQDLGGPRGAPTADRAQRVLG